jgi:DNA-binding MarR family transcriptional regulator/GNAT superfamily N-acetyltransferase
MTDEQVAALRRFNRVVTERIGALNDQYLARPRPLGASRVLWEIGPDGDDVRALRARLGLDSGYMSRLLRTLEDESLINLRPDATDSRIRAVTLTPAGLEERALLDKDSDALARSLLTPLTSGQRTRLVEAIATVEELLTAGLVDIRIEHPASDDAQYCIDRYFDELDDRFDTGFDPTVSISADVDELTEPAGLLLVARLRDEPIGCGALKFHDNAPAEIKRMWVSDSARGVGLGRRLLTELEEHARRRGVDAVRLETNKTLHEAISLYRSAGYDEVTAFNDEPFAHYWFEKRIRREEQALGP